VSTDRRRAARVQILGQLHGRAVTLDLAVTVTEISLGGMGILTQLPFPIGAVHDFQLTLGDGSVVTLRGRVVHCQKVSGEGDQYLSGVQFLDDAVAEAPEPA
jgi:c-di-GMP-binding flagellar brake protein YcgR